jgi:hypothetical protein
MTLRQKQSLFAQLISQLLVYLHDSGYEMTFGEAYRSPEEALRLTALGKGIPNSLHIQKLALDINLFKNGKYLGTSDAHKPLGEYWESLHPKCRWGGRFGDGNHYELRP